MEQTYLLDDSKKLRTQQDVTADYEDNTMPTIRTNKDRVTLTRVTLLLSCK